jgi:hypothetical protein
VRWVMTRETWERQAGRLTKRWTPTRSGCSRIPLAAGHRQMRWADNELTARHDKKARQLEAELHEKLGDDYQVNFEKFKDPSNDHIHIQYKPKPGL